MNESPYVVHTARIVSVREEAEGVKTFSIGESGGLVRALQGFRPGQFIELTVYGVGEAPFSVSHWDATQGTLELTVAEVGEVTQALHGLPAGSSVGIRGPYGNGFPIELLHGRDVVLVAGGIGLAPLKPVVTAVITGGLAVRSLTLLYGARTPRHVCFGPDIESWRRSGLVDVRLTVDQPDNDWKESQGPVTRLIGEVVVDPRQGKAIVCGPEIMMHVGADALRAAGWADDDIVLTLERRMECGIGKCGHCGVGPLLVCHDGPVFTAAELSHCKEYKET